MKKLLLLCSFGLIGAAAQAQNPQILNCPAAPLEFCDATANDVQFWNNTGFWNPVLSTHNLPEASAPLEIKVQDANPAGLSIDYLLFLDLDNNGTKETVVGPSLTSLPPGYVRYGNLGTPGYGGGQLRLFDGRTVPANKKYRFRLTKSVSGNTASSQVVWASSPGLYLPGKAPRLPYGTHRIKWTVTNSVGDVSICEYDFTVKDCAPPSVFCSNNLSVNLMPTGLITLWASDLLQYAEDNNGNDLDLALCPAGACTEFPTDAFGNPQTSNTWNCNDVGTQAVDLWAQDAYGNASFCQTYVTIQDNFSNCGGSNTAVICAKTLCSSQGQGIEEVSFELASAPPATPPFLWFTNSNNVGCTGLNVNGIPINGTYTLTAIKDDNPLNGVSIFDLYRIKQHLNGSQPFQYAWQYIAADINNDGVVSGQDTLDLKNLILGIYTELPNNTSWRFFVDTCDFQAPYPISCPQEILISDFSGFFFDQNFVGIKIGDLNCSAIANLQDEPVIDDRQAAPVESALVLDAQPNPTAGSAFIPLHLNEASTGRCELFDLNGRQVFFVEKQLETGWQGFELPAGAFPDRGVYAWRIQIGGMVKTGKVVRN